MNDAREPSEASRAPIVRALSRGLMVLGQFTLESPCLTLAELARKTGMHKATVHRIAKTLEVEGFLTRISDPPTYIVGPAWAASLYTLGTGTALGRILDHDVPVLAETCGETVVLSVRRGEFVQIVRVCYPSSLAFLPGLATGALQPLSANSHINSFIHLAFADAQTQQRVLAMPLTRYTDNTVTDTELLRDRLAAAKENRLAIEAEEYKKGICAVGVPVIANGQVMTAVAIVMPVERFNEASIERHTAHLQAAAVHMASRFVAAGGSFNTANGASIS